MNIATLVMLLNFNFVKSAFLTSSAVLVYVKIVQISTLISVPAMFFNYLFARPSLELINNIGV